MPRYALPLLVALLAVGAGCALLQKPPPPPSCTSYHAPGFDVGSLNRVLVAPLGNESAYPLAAEQIRQALATELQCYGRFEVVVPPPCPDLTPFTFVHTQGCFDEAICIQVARLYRVDAILAGAVTHYRPYPPPHIGLTLQLIRPSEGIVIASADGLWDARHKDLADATRLYYREAHLFQLPVNTDLALASPQLFQRFVCHDIVEALMEQLPPPPPAAPPGNGQTKDAHLEKLPTPRILPVSKKGDVESSPSEQLAMPRKAPAAPQLEVIVPPVVVPPPPPDPQLEQLTPPRAMPAPPTTESSNNNPQPDRPPAQPPQ